MSNQDFFPKHFAGKQIQIKANGKTITKTGNAPQTCYSQKLIPSQNTGVIYKWSFKINRRDHELVIGIASNHKTTDGSFHHNMKDINYGYSVENGQKVSKKKYSDYGCKCNKNDKIQMILNLQKKQLSFTVNNIDQGVMFTDIQQNRNTKYRLAVFTQGNGTSITLQKYEQITIDDESRREMATKEEKEERLLQNRNSKHSNGNTMNKILKQLEEQRVVQQKMDKRLKSIVEAIKEIKTTLEQQQHNTMGVSSRIGDSNSTCSEMIRNLKLMCYAIFVLIVVIGVVIFGLGSYVDKRDL
eukprot:38229_1